MGLIVNAGQREMTVNQLYMIGISVYQTLKHGRYARAARSLKIAIFNDGDNWLFSALHPILLPDNGRASHINSRK